jgi:tryptophan-rich sensory protein
MTASRGVEVDPSHPHANSIGRQALSLAGWLVLCFASSGTAAFVSIGGWYADLHKPVWNPPAWIFAPVWTLLYVMMAVAAWLVWREGGWKAQWRALGLFLLQWLLNTLWVPIFFGMHRVGLSFVEIVLLLMVVAVALMFFWRVSKIAGALLSPYLVWVSFASILNFTIWRLNS